MSKFDVIEGLYAKYIDKVDEEMAAGLSKEEKLTLFEMHMTTIAVAIRHMKVLGITDTLIDESIRITRRIEKEAWEDKQKNKDEV